MSSKVEQLQDLIMWTSSGRAGYGCPALKDVDWHVDNERLSGVTPHDKIHGKELAYATRYKKAKRFKIQVELSLRASGHVLRLFTHQYVKNGKTWKYGYASIGHFKSMDNSMVIDLAEAWQELGYMVRIAKAKWVEAELAVSMLNRMGEK
jgi:hypothetical protein